MLHLVTGPDSSHISRLLQRSLIGDSLQQPEDHYIAIVPEQATLQMQRSLTAAHPRQALMNIDIVSFGRLASGVFEETGYRMHSILNDTGKVLILRKVLMECREDLLVYRNKVRMPGFAEQIQSTITELRQYAIDDNDLFLMQESAEREGHRLLVRKLQDIRLIYRRFNETIAQKYATQEEILSVLARLAGDSRIICGSHIYIDGFTGFTPVQYRLIRELLRFAADVTVTVTMPEALTGRQEMFALSRTTLQKLHNIAQELKMPVRMYPDDHQALVPETFVYAAPDIRSEILNLSEQILHGVRTQNLRFRDFAVVLSDMEAYHHIVQEVFEQAGIPCFIDYKKPLGDNVLARFVLAALELVAERFSYDSVFTCLKCNMCKVPREQLHELENYCLAFGIRGVSAWKKDFSKNRSRKSGMSGKDTGEYWDLTEINRIRREASRDLLQFYEKCSGKGHTAGEISDALQELLKQIGAKEQMEACSDMFYDLGKTSLGKEYEQIYSAVVSLTDQIRDLMGEEVITAREYRDLLTGAMEDLRVGIIPPVLDAVPVGDLIRSRIENPKRLFLLGVNDSRIPSAPVNAGVLTAQERSFLKNEDFELAPDSLESLYTQYFYLYLLFTRPKETLFLSWARMGTDGEAQRPSYLLGSLKDILPGIEPKTEESEKEAAPFVQEPVLWTERAADLIAAAIRREADRFGPEDLKDGDFSTFEQNLMGYFARSHEAQFQQILDGAFFTNRPLDLDPQTVMDLYGEVLAGSVSRYERFYECPFRHFLDYGLALEKRQEFEIQAADLGTVYHESLELYSRKLQEKKMTFRNVSDTDSDALAREAVAEAASKMPGDILHSSERSLYLLKRMENITRKTVDVLRMQVRQGLYDPDQYEMAFHVEQQDGASFHGKIDRVDLYDGEDIFVKIIDYKSGKKKFSVRDIYSGLQLQLTAYLQAAMDKVQKKHPDCSVRPGGIYYYLIQDRYLHMEDDADEKHRMSGLTNRDEEALRAIDTESGPGMKRTKSTVAAIAYTKNGIDTRSQIAGDQEFSHLMRFVEERIRDAACRIRKGEVDIRPYCDGDDKSACTYCDYSGVCKFEAGKWGSDERRIGEDLTEAQIKQEVFGGSDATAGEE